MACTRHLTFTDFWIRVDKTKDFAQYTNGFLFLLLSTAYPHTVDTKRGIIQTHRDLKVLITQDTKRRLSFQNVHSLGISQTAHESHIDINIKLPQNSQSSQVGRYT